MSVLVTGAAGFIGYHTAMRLSREGFSVVGIDNLNPYYDVKLKQARLHRLQTLTNFTFQRLDIVDQPALNALFEQGRFKQVIHLAAQAGVRYSLDNPDAYAQSNLVGFLNVLEACRHHPPAHLIYASSSSVYGANTRMPFREDDQVDQPVSLYAATKRANELLAHSYCHLYGLQATGLRFFTVYGPWGRPDMSPIQFARAISEGEPLKLFNYGEHQRDFTYIDDIIESIARLIDQPPQANPQWDREQPDPASSMAPWRLFNIGGQQPVALKTYLALMEKHLDRKAIVELLPLQPGDVLNTCAEASDLAQATGFQPRIELDEGLGRFIAWFRNYYPTARAPLAAE